MTVYVDSWSHGVEINGLASEQKTWPLKKTKAFLKYISWYKVSLCVSLSIFLNQDYCWTGII